MGSSRPPLPPTTAVTMALALQQMPSEEGEKELRERRSHYTRKWYSKKKDTIASLRAALSELEMQYKELLDAQSFGKSEKDEQTGQALLLRRYVEVTELKQRLYTANEELFELINQHMMAHAAVQVGIDMLPSVFTRKPRFHDLPYEWYMHEIDECQRDAARFVARTKTELGGSFEVFGWTDRRSIIDDTLEFAFEKTFHHVTAEFLMQRTWSWLVSDDTNTAIYSRSLNPTVIKLREIDSDSVLFYWSLKPNDMPVVFKSVFVLARRRTTNGYMVLFRSIDKDLLRFDECNLHELFEKPDAPGEEKRSVYWAILNNWVVIRDDGPETVKYHFGGGSKASLWAIEVLLICMRWENFAFGSRLLPPPSPTSSSSSS